MPWLAQQLSQHGIEGCHCRLLKAYEVYDETMADQFRILAGTPRRPHSLWSVLPLNLAGLPAAHDVFAVPIDPRQQLLVTSGLS